MSKPETTELPRELTKNLSKNLCVCYDVTKQDVIDTIKQGAKTVEEVGRKTYACQGSGCCIRQVERLIELLHPPESNKACTHNDSDKESQTESN
jgi:NAD(P)H-nitrite reductase large subunit